MKKIIAISGLCAGLMVLGAPDMASAEDGGNYAPDETKSQVEAAGPVVAIAPLAAEAAEAEVAAAGPGSLPVTGGGDLELLQIGGVTVLVGGMLVVGTSMRRRRATTD